MPFSDIQGGSTLAKGLAPEAVVGLLNDYFTAMTQAVVANDGLLDKYIGDALMAVYGAPLPQPGHAYRACHTVLCMLAALQELRPRWQAQGLPSIDMGIGMNTGPMVVGNMESDLRFSYTVMGDEVNLGARLEGANKAYGTHIIISEASWGHVKDRLAVRELDVIRVTGRDRPPRIFEVLGRLPLTPAQPQRAAGLPGLSVVRGYALLPAVRSWQPHTTPESTLSVALSGITGNATACRLGSGLRHAHAVKSVLAPEVSRRRRRAEAQSELCLGLGHAVRAGKSFPAVHPRQYQFMEQEHSVFTLFLKKVSI